MDDRLQKPVYQTAARLEVFTKLIEIKIVSHQSFEILFVQSMRCVQTLQSWNTLILKPTNDANMIGDLKIAIRIRPVSMPLKWPASLILFRAVPECRTLKHFTIIPPSAIIHQPQHS